MLFLLHFLLNFHFLQLLALLWHCRSCLHISFSLYLFYNLQGLLPYQASLGLFDFLFLLQTKVRCSIFLLRVSNLLWFYFLNYKNLRRKLWFLLLGYICGLNRQFLPIFLLKERKDLRLINKFFRLALGRSLKFLKYHFLHLL